MLLKLEDFAAFRANWDDKVQNLRAIAAELSLGLDSFVFLDDNPLEREWVRSQLPEVAVVELGPLVFSWIRDLDRHGHFFSLTLTEEDVMRQRQYRRAADVQRLRSDSGSLDEFLENLQLEASVVPVSVSNLQRVTQLINKTNQFNLTTRRYTEEQVLQLASMPSGWSAAFHLRDRMGAYGLIGVMLCKTLGNPGEWEIDSWLLSCRALGRQTELFMFDKLMQAAIQRNIRHIRGMYRETKKNGLVSTLYERLGFSKINEVGGESSYLIQVPPSHEHTAKHIRDVSATSVTTPTQHAMAEEAVA
jgi:FkbH-like protein